MLGEGHQAFELWGDKLQIVGASRKVSLRSLAIRLDIEGISPRPQYITEVYSIFGHYLLIVSNYLTNADLLSQIRTNRYAVFVNPKFCH